MYLADTSRYDNMVYNRLGNSGLKLPAVSMGLWHNFGHLNSQEDMIKILCHCFDQGITHFDLANNYGPEPGAAETNFGLIMKHYLRPYRDELIISTKAGFTMWDGPYGDFGSRKYLLASLDQSLKRMGLEYVDIFYSHRMDEETDLEETMGALASAVQQGKALYVGLSNYDGPTLQRATEILRETHTPFVINQNRYSIYDRTIERNGLKDKAQELKKGIISFSPLAQGLLSDRYLNGIDADSRVKHDGRFLTEEDVKKYHASIVKLNQIAKERGQSLAQMALAWVLRDGAVASVLVGVSKVSQIDDNLKALANTSFTAEELQAIDEACAGLIQPSKASKMAPAQPKFLVLSYRPVAISFQQWPRALSYA